MWRHADAYQWASSGKQAYAHAALAKQVELQLNDLSDLNIPCLAGLNLSLSHCPESLAKAGGLVLKGLLRQLIQLPPVTCTPSIHDAPVCMRGGELSIWMGTDSCSKAERRGIASDVMPGGSRPLTA